MITRAATSEVRSELDDVRERALECVAAVGLGLGTGYRGAGVEFVIRDAFTRAKAYQREWQAYEKAKGAGHHRERRDDRRAQVGDDCRDR